MLLLPLGTTDLYSVPTPNSSQTRGKVQRRSTERSTEARARLSNQSRLHQLLSNLSIHLSINLIYHLSIHLISPPPVAQHAGMGPDAGQNDRVAALWAVLDPRNDGSVDRDGLKRGLEQLERRMAPSPLRTRIAGTG